MVTVIRKYQKLQIFWTILLMGYIIFLYKYATIPTFNIGKLSQSLKNFSANRGFNDQILYIDIKTENGCNETVDRILNELNTQLDGIRGVILSVLNTNLILSHYKYYLKPYSTVHYKTKERYWSEMATIPSAHTIAAICSMTCAEAEISNQPCCGIFTRGTYYNWGVSAKLCSIKHKFIPQNCRKHIGPSITLMPKDFNMPETKRLPKKKTTPNLYIHVITFGIITSSGAVLTDGYFIVPKSCDTETKVPKHTPKQFYREVFVISQQWGAQYYHANIENIPRIAAYLTFLQRHKDIRIHASSRSAFTLAALQVLGIDPDRVVTGLVSAHIVYLPHGGGCGELQQPNGLLLSRYYHQHCEDILLMKQASTQSEQGKSISLPPVTNADFASVTKLQKNYLVPYHFPEDNKFILIKRSERRWLVEHDDIAQKLNILATKLGFHFIVYDDQHLPSHQDTMLLFYQASLVVAPHGAGLTNLIFSKPGVYVLEVLCRDEPNLCYRQLAQSQGMHYYGMSSTSNCGAMTVNVSELIRVAKLFLRRIIKGL